MGCAERCWGVSPSASSLWFWDPQRRLTLTWWVNGGCHVRAWRQHSGQPLPSVTMELAATFKWRETQSYIGKHEDSPWNLNSAVPRAGRHQTVLAWLCPAHYIPCFQNREAHCLWSAQRLVMTFGVTDLWRCCELSGQEWSVQFLFVSLPFIICCRTWRWGYAPRVFFKYSFVLWLWFIIFQKA